jgi:hypothetical protein
MHRRFVFALAQIVLGLPACDSATDPPSRPQAVVNALTLREPGALTLDFEFRNRTSETLYLFECGGNVFTSVSVREPNGRTDTWGTICLGIWTVNQIAVASGAVFHGGRAVAARSGGAYSLEITYTADPNRMYGAQVVRAPTVHWRP